MKTSNQKRQDLMLQAFDQDSHGGTDSWNEMLATRYFQAADRGYKPGFDS
jgi:hypothetical protein